MMQQYVGEFFSKEYVMKNVLFLDEDQIDEMKKQMDDEIKSGEVEVDDVEDEQPQNDKPQQPNEY